MKYEWTKKISNNNMKKETKELANWIDKELNIIHIILYLILGKLFGGYWWILFGAFSLFSFISMLHALRNGGGNAYKKVGGGEVWQNLTKEQWHLARDLFDLKLK